MGRPPGCGGVWASAGWVISVAAVAAPAINPTPWMKSRRSMSFMLVFPSVVRVLRRLTNGGTRKPSCAPERSANGQCLAYPCDVKATALAYRPMSANAAGADRCRWGKSREEYRPCATFPAEASAAQNLDGDPSDGEPACPRSVSLGYRTLWLQWVAPAEGTRCDPLIHPQMTQSVHLRSLAQVDLERTSRDDQNRSRCYFK